jgi:phosphopentomutase
MKYLVIVIDSFGIGALPDAKQYGDEGANTILHICEHVGGEKWANLKKLGLGNCAEILGFSLPGCSAVADPLASYAVMIGKSPGKDTTTGHWEIAGLLLSNPFYTFPPDFPSFPDELLSNFKKATGRDILGNCAASGTEIIKEFGEEHMRTGKPIVYTSADSVFQVAAHEEVIPIDELYKICAISRKLCDEYNIARIIARPFEGKPGNFVRTKRRKDYSIALPGESILDYLKKNKIITTGVGKIGNIFNETGLVNNYPDKGNPACLERVINLLQTKNEDPEFIFVNLVDTDMAYGHRRDITGYAAAVEAIDKVIPDMINLMDKTDLLVFTADHGCDPAFRGTDHTREYVPLLVYQKGKTAKNLGVRETFADIAQSLTAYFGLPKFPTGKSFL